MTKYELTLITRTGDNFEPKSFDKVEGNSLIEILSQFLFVIHRSLKREAADEIKELKERYLDDDSIPF